MAVKDGMRIDDLPFPDEIKLRLRQEIKEFNPVQKEALPIVLDGRRLVVASPTASGKTLVAEIAMLKNYLQGGRSVYLVPLKALASEKYRELKEKYPFLRTALSIGDLDTADPWLESYDIIIASNEKMDSLLRHSAPWTKNISLLIVDEVHLLNDPGRGPTLEVVMTRMRAVPQIIALSATIRNAEQIAQWLGAQLVRSDYRPVKLERGVSYPDSDRTHVELEQESFHLPLHEHALVHDTIKKKKQVLYFVATRKGAEAAAEKLNVTQFLDAPERNALASLARSAERALPNPTTQCKRLARCIRQGTAFHHAGLIAKQRQLIEDAFRAGTLKAIAATPTLAYGVNTPAYRVLIRDTKRFDGSTSAYIPVMDIHQMAGRAGRPKYDSEGQAILLAKSAAEARDLRNRYLRTEPEPVFSKLGVEPVLRVHVLALIASGAVHTKADLEEFFAHTFFAHHYGDIRGVMEKVGTVLALLEDYKFIVRGEEPLYEGFKTAFDISGNSTLTATKIGKRVSELYLDPISAHTIIQNLRPVKELDAFMILTSCVELMPLLSVKKKDAEDLEDAIAKSGIAAPDVWSYEYEEFIEQFKTSLMYLDWMDEQGENTLLERYGVAPGELHNKLLAAEWLTYAAAELAILLNKKDAASDFNKLRLRIKHGVREELLRLIVLKGIGRVRARKLFRAGMKTPAQVRAEPEKVETILGKKIAQQLVKQPEELDDKVRAVKRRRP